MKQLVLSIFSILIIMMSSCAMPKKAATTPDGGNPLTFSCKGSTVTAVLEGNATTGCTWNYKIKDTKTVKYVSDEYVSNQAEQGIVGVGGKHTFVFEGIKQGTTYVIFNYGQHWKKGNDYGSRIMMIMVDAELQVTAAEVKIKEK